VSHLGAWVSALVDGQLSPAETERALAHVAGCPACADELAAARQARRALSIAPDVAPDPELTARLLALGSLPGQGQQQGPGQKQGQGQKQGHSPVPRRDPHRSVVPLGESAYAVPAKALSGDLVARRRSPARILAGSLAGAGVVLAALFVLGERPAVVPATHPAEALTALGRAPHAAPVPRGAAEQQIVTTLATTAGTSRDGSARAGGVATEADVLRWMEREGWSCPDGLPEGYEVTAVRLEPADDDGRDEVLEVDLAGPDGRVVITEQRGRLDVGSLGPVEERTIEGRTLYVLSLHPWHAVWQSDDTVVAMVSETPQQQAEDLVRHFPAEAYDDGLPARVTRGWATVTGALPIP
jgi:Putative zinc-finger